MQTNFENTSWPKSSIDRRHWWDSNFD